MTDRDNMIRGMCLTYRHDFGLLDEESRQFHIRQMEQIAYHNVDPVIIKAYRAGQEAMRERAAKKLKTMAPTKIVPARTYPTYDDYGDYICDWTEPETTVRRLLTGEKAAEAVLALPIKDPH